MNLERKGDVMVEKVVSTECSSKHYVAEACMFWCFDDRLWKLRKNVIKALGFTNVDYVQVAGACKDLAGDDLGAKEFLLRQIDVSVKLHGTKCIILVMHIDCGACGGSKAFADADAEWKNHAEVLEKAAEVVKNKFPQLQIDKYIADFEGLHRVLSQ
jgi:carbonic anhydrase